MTEAYERTRKSVRNSLVAIALQVVSLLLGFFSRKIFLDYLGTEVLGLNSTAAGILSFLNLAEMGIESAVAVTLYKPLYDGDRVSVREIIGIQGWIYKRVALFIIAASLVLMPFFPRIFSDMKAPMWYAYASFAVLLFSSLLGYFANYKQVILTADQNDYKVQLSFRSLMIAKVVFQMLGVCFLPQPYFWWLVFEVVFAIIASLNLRRTVNRSYPYIRESIRIDRSLIKKYPDVVTKVKQVFVKRMAFFFTVQSLPVFIYAYADLTEVAYYGNYMVLVNSCQAVMVAMFTGLTASVGNIVAEGDRHLAVKIFGELFTIRFFVTFAASFAMALFSSPFISLWLGAGYVLPATTVLLITLIFYVTMMQTAIDVFIDAYGLFSDVWSSLLRVALFLAAVLLLGGKFGLDGILMASLLQMTVVDFIWKPVFLFRKGLRETYRTYAVHYAKSLCAGCFALAAALFAMKYLPEAPSGNILIFLCYAFAVSAIFAILLFVLLLCVDKSAGSAVERIFKAGKK